MRNSLFQIFVCVIVLSTPCLAIADPLSEARLTELEQTVRSLQQRIAVIEARLNQTGNSSPVASFKTGTPNDINNWRQLRKGMSEQEVERLLGSPGKISVNVISTTWYYNYPTGGRIDFDATSRKVDAWTEP